MGGHVTRDLRRGQWLEMPAARATALAEFHATKSFICRQCKLNVRVPRAVAHPVCNNCADRVFSPLPKAHFLVLYGKPAIPLVLTSAGFKPATRRRR